MKTHTYTEKLTEYKKERKKERKKKTETSEIATFEAETESN